MHVIFADGIGSNEPGVNREESVLYSVVKRLAVLNKEYKEDRVEWPASMAMVGGTKSWNESTRIGISEINKIVSEIGNDTFILLGYSGGCRVIHEWMEQNPNDLGRVKSVGLLSDPFRPKNRNVVGVSKTKGWGICGQKKGPIPNRTFWAANPGDVITDALPNSLLRTAADASDVMPYEMLGELHRHLMKGDLQLAHQLNLFRTNPLTWFTNLQPRFNQARIDIQGYLGEEHTTAYLKPYAGGGSLAHRLAEAVNWQATRSN